MACEDNFHNWDHLFESCAMYDYSRLEKAIEEVAIRYAQEQNKKLIAWTESASKILNNIDLQQLGKLLSMQYGSAIDKQLLPAVTKLVEQNKELVDMLEEMHTQYWDMMNGNYSPFFLRSCVDKAKELIKSAKQI